MSADLSDNPFFKDVVKSDIKTVLEDNNSSVFDDLRKSLSEADEISEKLDLLRKVDHLDLLKPMDV